MSKRKFVDVTPIIEEFKIRGVELNGCDPVVYGVHKGFAEAAKILSKAPAADVIHARYGEWVHSEGGEAHCSECGCTVYGAELSPYCPHCGANMEADA